MPPKRRAKKEDTIDVVSNNDDTSPPKKLKTDEPIAHDQPKVPDDNVTSKSEVDDEDESLPKCVYWDKCYRKNPQHFKEFRHPTEAKANDKDSVPTKKKVLEDNNNNNSNTVTVELNKGPTSVSNDNNSSIDSYKSILHVILSKQKISADEKKLMRQYRRKHNIQDSEHTKLIKLFGWTEDEYEDGAKQDDDIELEEELGILENENGFKIIEITKEDANKNKVINTVFSKVCTKFYETMSKAQANFTVTKVGVIVNTKLKKQYNTKKLFYCQRDGEETKEEWGFHGSTKDSILKIALGGFLHPDDLKKLKQAVNVNTSKAKPKKKKNIMKEKPVELLDDGYYGKGIYFTTYSDYAMWYSSERESDQVLLCKLLPGKSFKCFKRMDGLGCQIGHDSHVSPRGNEIVVFNSDQILPRYIVSFIEREASEREQES